MAMSPQQLEIWARRRTAGQPAYRRRTTLVAAVVFTAAIATTDWLQLTHYGWKQVAFMGAFFGIGMYFISGAVWQRNEAEYLKLSNRGA